jgi:hypothetical protein
VGSVLHGVLPPLQPAHGKITRLRVYSMRLNALFRLAFAPAPHHWLTSPHTVTRRLILQKARHRGHGRSRDDALTDCKPTVSGTISLPSRGTFHHSLTVLFAIGHLDILSLTRWSSQIHARLHGSGATRDDYRRLSAFRVRGSYPLWRAVPERFHYASAL